MVPDDVRSGDPIGGLHFAVAASSLGSLLIAASGKGIVAILFGDDDVALAHDLKMRFGTAKQMSGHPAFDAIVAKVSALVDAPHAGLDVPLDLRGTAFQIRVWQALREIPAGTTVTYGRIAERIGRPKAVRAVASACAANAIAVAIPCHRVVRGDGALSGYRWGVDRKRHLLNREAAAVRNGQTRGQDPVRPESYCHSAARSGH
jgi:AraC family transcriptional regulator, regulatory protein of adaptative response / methylated-DNA-[protein]-cysteine methyltransferase